MKLIFVNRYFYPDHSATAQLLSSLALALIERGWDVHVVSSRQLYNAASASLPSTEVVNGIKIDRVWTSRFGRARLSGRMADYVTFYGSAAWRLWRLARSNDIIVSKSDPPMLSVVAAGAAKMRSARLVNWVQDLFPEVAQALEVRGVDGAAADILRGLRNRSLRFASTNVVLGERMREKIKDAGVTSARVDIVPNWECGRVIRPIARGDNQLRREWGLGDKFVVGYSGNMGRAHEFDTILKAARLLNDNANVVFVWIGDGAQRLWLERESLRWGLTNFVFRPYQPRNRLFESLSLPDVHLISLRPALEGLIVPSKIYGIVAAGRPALFIGEMDGEVAMLLRRHRCGYNIKPGDSEDLVARICALNANRKMCLAMGARARQCFEANYDEQDAFNRWEKILQQVARVSVRQNQYESTGESAGLRVDTRSRVRARTDGALRRRIEA